MNSNAEPPLRRRDEARAIFRNAILDAAEAVFAERGFHGARIQDIAERARTAVGTVYNHFEDKDDVLGARLEQRSEEMIAQLHPVEDDRGPFDVRLRVRVARVLSYVQAHRAFFAIANEQGLFAGTVAPGAHATHKRLRHVERLRAVFDALVEEGLASGDLEPLPGDALARFLGGTIRAFVLSSIAQRTADVNDDATTIVDLFLHGAARRKSSRRPKVLRKPAAGQ
ncbi:MAG TPA: TetR/AcrR family transcriptional regulator [Polyangiaceae bacterium]|nr:TetR/AcrR family transcriptional regulator [Polyangiaceae bacterium]